MAGTSIWISTMGGIRMGYSHQELSVTIFKSKDFSFCQGPGNNQVSINTISPIS